MALIDALPMFKLRSIEIDDSLKTKLAPKPEDKKEGTKTEQTGNTSPPTLSQLPEVPSLNKPPEIPSIVTKPVETIKEYSVKKPSIKLPSQYSAMEPLMMALDDSTVVNPKAKLAIISQMGLEKGWKLPKDFSFGNITAGGSWTGPVQVRPDKDAQGRPITQKFRSYDSPKAFVDDYMKLLRTQYPDAYAALHDDEFDVNKFTAGLVGGKYKYAQDPKYQDNVSKVYYNVLRNTLGII